MNREVKSASACLLVIFGSTGDLTQRLLLPALAHLKSAGLVPDEFAVLAVGRGESTSDAFRTALAERVRTIASVDTAASEWQWLLERIEYLRGDPRQPGTFERLRSTLGRLADRFRTAGNVLFYLATPPDAFGPIVERLAEAGLTDERDTGWRRVVIEKPFGTDLASAQALNRRILERLDESQVFRIDHFLGKETVQNILALRFSNGIFEPLWNRHHIDHVQLSVTETLGVEQRGAFYDGTGALRDMMPSHLFQLLALVAMEAPVSFTAPALRTEKLKVLEAVRGLDADGQAGNVVRGQYGAGLSGDGPVQGYREEPRVAPGSTTETYVAMKLLIDNWRWAGVPFYLRTGKRLSAKSTQVAIQFRQAPLSLFRSAGREDSAIRNYLVLQLQPDEGISWRFGVKTPGPGMHIEPATMDFRYADQFDLPSRTGYETLIHDCMNGDPLLFQRADFVEAGWRVLQPLLDAWQEDSAEPPLPYPAGSEGPGAADRLLEREGRSWCPAC